MDKSKKAKKAGENDMVKIIAIFVAIIIVIVIAITILVKNNDKKQEIQEDSGIVDVIEANLIDFNNLENAKLEDGVKVNTSEKAKEEKKYNELTFNGATIVSKDGMTNFNVTVTNNGKNAIESQFLEVRCVNANGEDIGSLYLYISSVAAGETANLNASVGDDYINLYDYYIKEAEPFEEVETSTTTE